MDTIKLVLIAIVISCLLSCKNTSQKQVVEKPINVAHTKKLPIVNELIIDTIKTLKRNKDKGHFHILSKETFNHKDFDFLSKRELRIMRNEIFARLGYKFKSEDLQLHFSNTTWYVPLYSNVDKLLNDIEKNNIAVIQECEKTAKLISSEEQFAYFISLLEQNKFSELPTFLSLKFNIGHFSEIGNYPIEESLIWENTKDYAYILTTRFEGCNECPDLFEIFQYNKKGELLEVYHLGSWIDNIQVKDSLMTCITVSYPIISFEDTTEVLPEQIDTTFHSIMLQADGSLFISNQEKPL